jgi:2-oxoglutarate ferredoxin oxidoreductase subunit delta
MFSMTGPAVQESAAAKPARQPKGPRGKVTIFGLWCKGCRLCVEFCPTGVLDFNAEEKLVVVHPERCSACHWCDTHCPDLAIIVTPVEA